jgi:hypothetical protein
MLTSTPRAPGEVDVLEQRAPHGRGGRLARALFAARGRRAHHRHADLAHHGAHVGEVDVDQARVVDDLGDARHGAVQHVVRRRVGLQQRHARAQHLGELLVRDDDERVDALRELLDAGLRDLLALALELERPRHDRDGQHAHALRDVGDDRRRAGAGAAAHARGDEQHVGAGDELLDALAVLHRRVAADLRPRAAPRPARERRAELQLHARRRALERLRVGVRADEVDAREPLAIMCSTALPPQPPTPMTLMTAPSCGAWSMISNMVLPFLSGVTLRLGMPGGVVVVMTFVRHVDLAR